MSVCAGYFGLQRERALERDFGVPFEENIINHIVGAIEVYRERIPLWVIRSRWIEVACNCADDRRSGSTRPARQRFVFYATFVTPYAEA